MPEASHRRFAFATNDFLASFLAPALRARLEAEAPRIELNIRFGAGRSALDMVSSGAVDLAIGRFDAFGPDQRALLLGQERYVVLARGSHPQLAAGLDMERYLAAEHVLVSFDGGFQGTIDQHLTRIGHRRRVVATVPMFMAALAIASASQAITTVPERLAIRFAPAFGLELHALPFAMPDFDLHLVHHARNEGDPGLAWMVETIRSLFR